MRHINRLCFCLFAAFVSFSVLAQQPPMEKPVLLVDGLNLESTVTTQVTPDMAVIVMAVDKEGTDTAVLTSETNQILAKALGDAKATPGVLASSGGYNTTQIYNNKGQRTGWHVRAELILKSKDFGSLGKLAGKLSSTMQIAQNSFEVSPELKASEEQGLIERGIAALQQKAKAAVKALGYKDFVVREITLGSAFVQGGPQPMMRASMAKIGESTGEPMPIENGRVNMQLSVNGQLTMKR
ncbi:MAG: SIMPL domain-containing protein [Burkholderiales bacterium]